MDAAIITPTTEDDRLLVERLRALTRDPHRAAREFAFKVGPHSHHAPRLEALATGRMPSPEAAERRKFVRRQIELLESAAAWPAPPELRVAHRSGELKIDGRLDEPAWRAAAPIPLRYNPNDALPPRAQPASARLLWDERFLYVGYEVQKWPILADRVGRDGPTYEHDCVELFLLPEERWGVYWEVVVTPHGDVYDALNFKRFDREDFMPRIDETIHGLETGVAIRPPEGGAPGGYGVELAVPWSEMPWTANPPRAGTRIQGLLSMADRHDPVPGAKPTYYAHAPILGSFHNIWGYSTIVLD